MLKIANKLPNVSLCKFSKELIHTARSQRCLKRVFEIQTYVEMMARVSTSDNHYLIQKTRIESKTILKNSGRYSVLYRTEADPWK
jgi:precorrin-6x reductase